MNSNPNTPTNLLVKPRRKYNRIEDEEKRRKVAEANKKWASKNPDKKRMANLLFRQKDPTYGNEYELKKRIEQYGSNVPLPPKNKKMSKPERTWKNNLKLQFPEYTFKKIRPDWLRNTDSKRNLEIDLYCETLKLAIEVSGEQHFRYIPFFHKSNIKNFLYQQYKDNLKANLCRELGIRLIVISKRDKPLDVLTKIQKYIDSLYFV